MKKPYNLIIYKPLGAKIDPEVLKDSHSNNDLNFSVFSKRKDHDKYTISRVENDTYSSKKWANLENSVGDKYSDEYESIFWFGSVSPPKDGCLPFRKNHKIKKKKGEEEIVETLFHWHSGSWKTIAYFGNEEISCFETLLAPVSITGARTLIKFLAEEGNGEFLTYYKEAGQLPVFERFGTGWQEIDGVWFSNSSYKKKVVIPPPITNHHYTSSTKRNGRNTTIIAEEDEVVWEGIGFRKIGEGLRKYFGLNHNLALYVSYIDNKEYKPRAFQLMDFVETIQGTPATLQHIKKLKEKEKRRFSYDAKVVRVNSLEFSRGVPLKEASTIIPDIDLHNFRLDDKKKHEVTIIERSGVTIVEENLLKLSLDQRRWIITGLINKFKGKSYNGKEFDVKLMKKYFHHTSDEELKEKAELYDIKYVGIDS